MSITLSETSRSTLGDIIRSKFGDSDSKEKKEVSSSQTTNVAKVALKNSSSADSSEEPKNFKASDFTPRPIESKEEPQPPKANESHFSIKLKKASMEDSLANITEKFQELMEEWTNIKETAGDVKFTEVGKLQESILEFKGKLTSTKRSLDKIEPSFLSILDRLGPARTNQSMEKGKVRGDLRNTIVQQWSSLWLMNYQLDLETKNLSKQISHLPQLLDLNARIKSLRSRIRNFKNSEANTETIRSWFIDYVYIRDTKKVEFLNLRTKSRENFVNLYNEAKCCKENLQKLKDNKEEFPEQDLFASQIAFNNSEQMELNIKEFEGIRKQAILDESDLQSKITSSWAKICEKLDKLQAKVIQIEIAAATPEMLLPYEKTARKQMDPKYILNPDISVAEEDK